MDSGLTPKAEQTRQHILDTALDLFAAHGYKNTSMRDIAAAADCSLGLTYRYFASKEDLVLMLYQRMAAQTLAEIEQLPPAPVAERFHQVMTHRLAQASVYRDALGALFGASMDPESAAGILGDGAAQVRAQTQQAFLALVRHATDAPREPQAEQLATVLYSTHFALILFWLYDHSPDQQQTDALLAFVRDLLGMTRTMLILPLVSNRLARLSDIMGSVFAEE